MKEYIEERAIGIANYIIESNATVRQTAKAFGVSKSIVHTVVTKWNGFYGWWSDKKARRIGEFRENGELDGQKCSSFSF